jgi:uncharacterized protein YgiM (DUF1202 family)
MRKSIFTLVLFTCVLMLSVSVMAQSGVVRAVVSNENANVRIVPAIGAELRGTVPAGFVFDEVTGRSPDNEWIRVVFNGEEAWVNLAPLTVLEGDVSALPVADPRTIPYGGFEAPRAGRSDATSNISARLPNSGLRLRAGPSTGYPVLANLPRYTVVPVLGRTLGNSWIQVNFEGTLGWITSGFVDITVPPGTVLSDLPLDGVVADAPPLDDATPEDLIATLQLMLARIDLAQPSLDAIRTAWTDAGLTGRASCQPYPARPSGYNIPNPLLAAYFPTLDPLITLFNDAMFNVRLSIDLFIEVCEQPGTVNAVGQATVIGALEAVSLADSQFAELRRRLNELIPEEVELGDDECLFTFQGASEILPLINLGQIVFDSFSPDQVVTGYCFDAIAGQQLLVETLQFPDSNVVHLASISPFDNPTNFLLTVPGSEGLPALRGGPLTVPATGRYLLILSDASTDGAPPQGEFALIVYEVIPNYTTNLLQPDPLNPDAIILVTPDPSFFLPPTPSFGGPPFVTVTPSNQSPFSGQPGGKVVCPGLGLTCEQLASCDEAYACLAAGNFSLDSDDDGVPCEVLRCPSS